MSSTVRLREEGAADKAGPPPGVALLDLDGERIGPDRIRHHQNAHIVRGDLRKFRPRHARAPAAHLDRLALLAEAAACDEAERCEPRPDAQRDMGGDEPAERETRQADILVRLEQLIDARRQPVGEQFRRRADRNGVGIAEARHVGYGEPEIRLQMSDHRQPVQPASEAAVQQHERRPRYRTCARRPAPRRGRCGRHCALASAAAITSAGVDDITA